MNYKDRMEKGIPCTLVPLSLNGIDCSSCVNFYFNDIEGTSRLFRSVVSWKT